MKKKNAISLIVLVITIIVMAILSATVIITLSNTNIINEAQKAKDATNQASEKEVLSVALAEWKIVETKGTKTFKEFMQEKFGQEKVVETNETEVTVTMESGNKYNITKDGKTTKMEKASKGMFVEYAVSYTDMLNSNNKYTTTNGWRLLDYTDNGDGTYSNVKLISTGVPAMLSYETQDTKNNSWFVTDDSKLTEFKNVLGSGYTLYTGTGTYTALQAAAGLYYNFGDVKFGYGARSRGKNLGNFTEITNNGTMYNSENTEEITGDKLFIPTGVSARVRLLTLPEMNKLLGRTDMDSTSSVEDTTGIFELENIKDLPEMSSFTYGGIEYSMNLGQTTLLSSPYPLDDMTFFLVGLDEYGGISYCSNTSNNGGVRPLITLLSDVQFTDTNGDGVLELVL